MREIRLISVIQWLVILAVPFFLALATVRLLISWDSPSYPEFEYGRISQDRYGFTPEERLEYATASLDYLRQPEPAEEVIYLLEELRLPGTDQPFYNDREIDHMLDVKRLSDAFGRIATILGLIALAGTVILLIRRETRLAGYLAIMRGGLFTAGLLLATLVLLFLAWNLVFTQFHELLFPPNTWTFNYSDSLIRLFPEQFWFDFALIWTGAIFLEGVILFLAGYLLQRSAGST